ncbi:HAD family hydrolase [Vibrio furnissii]|uniref:HAD family hydrolase n=1 Tax=Vibrio furnissii TaxID=29494 RepID=UPI0023DA3C42|nr:HAD hydrolase-like protein [Vibrio furnissii]
MLKFNHYDVIIFDCDGVILDSNNLKISAMRVALENAAYPKAEIDVAVEYFAANFGKSRFYHIAHFVDHILTGIQDREAAYNALLCDYSTACKQLYVQAEMTENFNLILEQVSADKHVASGSEQEELRQVFIERGMASHFGHILGSPVAKVDNVARIIASYQDKKILMVGDAKSDFDAAQENGIDFAFYLPYSNVQQQMLGNAGVYGFPVIHSFKEVL